MEFPLRRSRILIVVDWQSDGAAGGSSWSAPAVLLHAGFAVVVVASKGPRAMLRAVAKMALYMNRGDIPFLLGLLQLALSRRGDSGAGTLRDWLTPICYLVGCIPDAPSFAATE